MLEWMMPAGGTPVALSAAVAAPDMRPAALATLKPA